MAQDVVIAGATYEDVPSIEVPLQGGGTASFMDTSDGDVIADDVSVGKICYSQGQRIVGTNSGGGVVPQDTYYRVGNIITLSHYSGGWISTAIVGSNLSISSSSRTDWKICRCSLDANKKYYLGTYLTDGGALPFVVSDSNNIVVAVPHEKWTGGGVYYSTIDTSNYDSTNGLYLNIDYGDTDNFTLHMNELPPNFNRGYVFCAELLTYGGQ